jgi:prepilin-type N-terminal cleavage/methylation domain-containing protein
MDKKNSMFTINFKKIKKSKSGFTLIELIIVLAILGIVATAIYSMNLFGIKTFAAGQDRAQKQYDVRMAADFLAKQLRYAHVATPRPASQSPGSSQIYLDANNHIIYNKNGSITNVPGISNSSYYKLSFTRISNKVIEFTIGSLDDKFSVTSQVTVLNIATQIPNFSNVSGLEFFINFTSPPIISDQPGDKIVNVGGTALLSVTASGTGSLSYQWYSNSTNSNSGGSIISGATNSSYSAPTSTEGVTYYYCIVTNTDIAAVDTKTASTTSSTAKVEVSSITNATPPTINTEPQDKTVNVGGTALLSITASGTGTISYQWYRNSTNSSSGGNIISGATGNSYSAPTTASGTTYYYCVVTNTDNAATGNKTATTTSNVVRVLVNASGSPTIPEAQISARTANTNGSSQNIKSVGPNSYQVRKGDNFIIDIKNWETSDSSLTITFEVTGTAVLSISDIAGNKTNVQFTAGDTSGLTGTVKAVLKNGTTVLATSNVLTFETTNGNP